ncbi:MAG TPA: hypothetical protein VF517_11615 [Thermoleophilaceae bacterium]|jgi:hypothetical protein
MADQTENGEERLDWTEAEMHPMTASGFMLVVRGVAKHPMKVRLRPTPIGIVPDEDGYRGVVVLGKSEEFTTQVETPWTAQIDTKEVGDKIELIGATKKEYFPPKDG